MSKQTEAMKLALEALEWINRVSAMDYEYQQKARESLNAIYEALALVNEVDQEQPAQPSKPLTDEQIDALMPEADGTAEANKVWVKDGDFPYCEYDEVDAWSKPLVIQIARAIEAAHGIKEKNSD